MNEKNTMSFLNRETWFGVEYLRIVRLLIGLVFFCAGVFLPLDGKWISLLMLICFVISGYDIVLRAVSNVLEKRYLDEHLMIFIAVAAAFFIGASYEAAAVTLIFQLGIILRAYVNNEIRCRIDDHLGYYPTLVTVLRDGEEVQVLSEHIAAEDIMIIRTGEMFPVDCIVTEGTAVIDRSLICGEGDPVCSVEEGDTVFAGCYNAHHDVTVRALAPADRSLTARLKQYTEDTSNGNGDAAFFIERIAHIYAPFALGVCVLIGLIASIFVDGAVSEAIHRALVVLIITCPSTFLVSVPLAYLAGTRSILRSGVLVKGPAVLDDLTRVSDILFEKDGLITTGKFRISSIKSPRMDPAVLLKVAAHAQANAHGAVAETIVHAYEGVIDRAVIDSFTEYENGIIAQINEIPIAMGSYEFLKEQETKALCANDGSHSVYMSVSGVYAGHIILSDVIRSSAPSMVMDFENIGCRSVMLTSDAPEKARAAAEAVGIYEYRALCMPMDKLAIVQEMKENRPEDCVLFIAADTDETPVLAAADIGATLQGIASENALESGDVVIMNHAPEKLAPAISVARNVHNIIRQNLIAVAAVKLVVFLLALIGVADQLWFAFFVDMIVSVATMLNAYRAIPADDTDNRF